MARADFWRALPGYVATALLTLATALWTYWGVGEMYYEGWGQPFPDPLAYLVPAGACLVLTLVVLTWPIPGGWLTVAVSAGFTAWWWAMTASRGRLTVAGIASMFPVSGVLVLVGVLFLLEGRYRRQLRAAGWVPPRRWLRRNARYLLALGAPLLVTLVVSAVTLPTLLTRTDDGNYGAREIRGYGVTLVWAPAGPGWGQGSSEAGENVSWDELAWYGVPPVGLGGKGLSGNATAEDMRSTGLCRYLDANGLTLKDTPQDIWRMPTTDELVRSLVRDGANAGCTWDGQSERADCGATPDKETPLWAPGQWAIYYWSGEEYEGDEAYYVSYNGRGVAQQRKSWANPRHGYRCVREP
jgi:hypothetical protein